MQYPGIRSLDEDIEASPVRCIEQVLVPEAICLLMQEDMRMSAGEAFELLEDESV